MKVITAKFKSTCAETGATIKKGAECLHDNINRCVYSLGSTTYKQWEEKFKGESGHVEQADIANDNWYRATYGNDIGN